MYQLSLAFVIGDKIPAITLNNWRSSSLLDREGITLEVSSKDFLTSSSYQSRPEFSWLNWLLSSAVADLTARLKSFGSLKLRDWPNSFLTSLSKYRPTSLTLTFFPKSGFVLSSIILTALDTGLRKEYLVSADVTSLVGGFLPSSTMVKMSSAVWKPSLLNALRRASNILFKRTQMLPTIPAGRLPTLKFLNASAIASSRMYGSKPTRLPFSSWYCFL